MRASLRYLHCPDIDNIENWQPATTDFGIYIQAMIGPSDSKGEESFGFTVCTPAWFEATRLSDGRVVSGLHTLFMSQFDYPALKSFVERAVHRAEADSWHELARSLSWLGEWEFENYRA